MSSVALTTLRRNRWLRRGAIALTLAAVFLGIRSWQQRDMAVGRAPPLDGVTIDGRTVSASGSARATLVYFWATWCPVCRLEEGTIESIAADHPVVTVAMQSGSDTDLSRHQRERGHRLVVLNDATGETATGWGVRVTPTFFVIDRDGQIRFRETGYTSEVGLRIRLWWASR